MDPKEQPRDPKKGPQTPPENTREAKNESPPPPVEPLVGQGLTGDERSAQRTQKDLKETPMDAKEQPRDPKRVSAI
jgi:hypothetical protein